LFTYLLYPRDRNCSKFLVKHVKQHQRSMQISLTTKALSCKFQEHFLLVFFPPAVLKCYIVATSLSTLLKEVHVINFMIFNQLASYTKTHCIYAMCNLWIPKTNTAMIRESLVKYNYVLSALK